MLCLECNNKESDHALRVYRCLESNRTIQGTRNFCSDTCEQDYCNWMDQKYPEESALIVRLA